MFRNPIRVLERLIMERGVVETSRLLPLRMHLASTRVIKLAQVCRFRGGTCPLCTYIIGTTVVNLGPFGS